MLGNITDYKILLKQQNEYLLFEFILIIIFLINVIFFPVLLYHSANADGPQGYVREVCKYRKGKMVRIK